ncbi:MAG: hypothetical protein HYV95_05135 [Opitutae bacterium]|nr:hypothetical protein [Opitutae bacterium]
MPFPPPVGTPKFPPPSAAAFPPPAKTGRPGGKKKLVVLGGVAVIVLGLGAGAFFYFTKTPPPPPPKPVAKKPVTPPAASAQQVVEKVKQEQLAPINEVVSAEQTAKPAATTAPVEAKPAETAPATTTAAVAKPVIAPAVVPAAPPKPAPPPPANLQFKAWVENLKIAGVRSGANPRVFIGRTAYAPGDMVNPQLGISFKGYDPETRMLSFTDNTGAIVERRN